MFYLSVDYYLSLMFLSSDKWLSIYADHYKENRLIHLAPKDCYDKPVKSCLLLAVASTSVSHIVFTSFSGVQHIFTQQI